MKRVNNFPFLAYGIFGVVLQGFVYLSGAQYDESGVAGFLWWAAIVFSLPFALVGKFIGLEGAFVFLNVKVMLGGLLFCSALDAVWFAVRIHRRSKNSEQARVESCK